MTRLSPIKFVLFCFIALTSTFCFAEQKAAITTKAETNPQVVFHTSEGDIQIELYPKEAPLTVANFLQYIDDGFYDGVIFHRIVPGFVIQGGGFTFDFRQKATRPPIKNESDNQLKNAIGTLSMARTSVIDSATAQFFINTQNNFSLDASQGNNGYAVFGKVIKGFDVVKKIESEPRGQYIGHPEAPNKIVIIEKARRVALEPSASEQKASKEKASEEKTAEPKTSVPNTKGDK